MAVKMVKGMVVNITTPANLTSDARKTANRAKPQKAKLKEAVDSTENIKVTRRNLKA